MGVQSESAETLRLRRAKRRIASGLGSLASVTYPALTACNGCAPSRTVNYLYNIPQYTKVVAEPTTVATLAREGTIHGIKDSSRDDTFVRPFSAISLGLLGDKNDRERTTILAMMEVVALIQNKGCLGTGLPLSRA